MNKIDRHVSSLEEIINDLNTAYERLKGLRIEIATKSEQTLRVAAEAYMVATGWTQGVNDELYVQHRTNVMESPWLRPIVEATVAAVMVEEKS
jgi:hypothetical protein